MKVKIILLIYFILLTSIFNNLAESKSTFPKEFESILQIKDPELKIKAVSDLLNGNYKDSIFLFYVMGEQNQLISKDGISKEYYIKAINSTIGYGEDQLQFKLLAMNNLSFILKKEKNYLESIKYANTVINSIEEGKVKFSDKRTWSMPYYIKASALFGQKEFQESRNIFKTAFSISEEEATVGDWCEYGSLYWGNDGKDLKTSIEIFNRGESYFPNDPNITFNRARAFIASKMYKEALEDLLITSLTSQNKSPAIREETAKKIIGIFSLTDNENYYQNYSQGIVNRHNKNYELAKELLLKITNSNKNALFAYLCLGEIAKNTKDYPSAIGYFNKIKEQKPNLAYLAFSYAETYYFMGDKRYKDFALKSIKLDPGGSTVNWAKELLTK